VTALLREGDEAAGLFPDNQVIAPRARRFKVPTTWLLRDQVLAGHLRDSVVLCCALGEFAMDIPQAWLIRINEFPISEFPIFLSLRALNQVVWGLTHLRKNLALPGQRQ
jgi:hypothetical protein